MLFARLDRPPTIRQNITIVIIFDI